MNQNENKYSAPHDTDTTNNDNLKTMKQENIFNDKSISESNNSNDDNINNKDEIIDTNDEKSLSLAESITSLNGDSSSSISSSSTSTSSSSSSTSSDDDDDMDNANHNNNNNNSTYITKMESNSYMVCIKNNNSSINNNYKEIGFIGKAKVELYHGCIDIYGYALSQQKNDNDECSINIINTINSNESFETYCQKYTKQFNNKVRSNASCDIYNSVYFPIIPIKNNTNTSIFKIIFESKEYVIIDNDNNIILKNITKKSQKQQDEDDDGVVSLIHVPNTWKDTIDTMISQQLNKQYSIRQRVLICGAEGSGKKLMLGYIVNRLLSFQQQQRQQYMIDDHNNNDAGDDIMSLSSSNSNSDNNEHQHEEDNNNNLVYILDVNVEHPCMGYLPGIITLSSTTIPLLSPSYNRINDNKLVYSSFYGYKRPKDNPNKYISCIKSCIDYYNHNINNTKHPLIIITHGWIHRLGYDIILPNVITTINPNYIIQLGNAFTLQKYILHNENDTRKHFSVQEYRHEYVCNTTDSTTNEDGHPIQPIMKTIQNNNKNIYKNHYFIMEVFIFICYFLNTTNNKMMYDIISSKNGNRKIKDKYCYSSRMLASMNPIVISYYAVTIIIDDDENNNNMLSSIMKEDDECNTTNDSSIQNNKNDIKDMVYKILNGSLVGLLSSNSSCVGIGIIRSIDTIQNLLFILTPLSIKEIEEYDIKTLHKYANVSIPFPLLRLGYNNNSGGDSIACSQPYVQHTIMNNNISSYDDNSNGGKRKYNNVGGVGNKGMKSKKHWNKKC